MLGKSFLRACLASGQLSEFLKYGKIDHLFRDVEKPTFDFFLGFVKQYGSMPSEDTIKTHTGEGLHEAKEPSEYYLDLMKSRYTEFEVKKAMKSASDHLLPAHKDPEAALQALTEVAVKLAHQQHLNKIVDFRDAYDLIIPEYVKQLKQETGDGFFFGWPTLDNATGGVRNGDLVSIIGRPGLGKTWAVLYAAMFGWNAAAMLIKAAIKAHVEPPQIIPQSRMFVSMEMQALPIVQRLASIHNGINPTWLKHAALPTDSLKKLKKGLTEIKGHHAPFWVVDGNLTSTVEDVWMLARQLKPDGIVIDGGYLLQHPTERDRFRRVAENCNLIKKNLAPLAPTAVTWQFAKTATKKNTKKGEKVGLDDIGYTDAIAQDSSIVVGLFEEDSVETLQSRLFDILKGRWGEAGQFRTRWNFAKADFREIEKEKIEELSFL